MNKKNNTPLLAGLLLCLMLLNGCASSQALDPDVKTDARKAAESNTQLGLQYMERGQLEVALGKLKKAVKEDPGYAPGHTVLAVLYERIGESELAGKHYQKAFQIDPANGDVNNNYGTYLCRTGNEQKAIPHFLTALDDPFYRSPAVALTNAGSCAMSQDMFSEADNYLRSALKYDPKFPDALLAMANLNYRQENYFGSRAFLQRFDAAGQQTPESLLLGYKIEKGAGDDRAARRYLSLLNNTYPESEEAEEARRILRP